MCVCMSERVCVCVPQTHSPIPWPTDVWVSVCAWLCVCVYDSVHRNCYPQNPPNLRTLISQYLAVQIRIEILVYFEFVPRNLSFWIWWISGLKHFQWKLSYVRVAQTHCPILRTPDVCVRVSVCACVYACVYVPQTHCPFPWSTDVCVCLCVCASVFVRVCMCLCPTHCPLPWPTDVCVHLCVFLTVYVCVCMCPCPTDKRSSPTRSSPVTHSRVCVCTCSCVCIHVSVSHRRTVQSCDPLICVRDRTSMCVCVSVYVCMSHRRTVLFRDPLIYMCVYMSV